MANKLHKDRLVVSIASLNPDTGKWKVMVEISHKFFPPEEFESQESAEAFGLQFAAEYIDTRDKKALSTG
jgi:hypothetical protein